MTSRFPRLLTLVSLLVGTMAVLGGTTSPAQAAPGDFIERWCSSHAAPCLESVKRNGVNLTVSDPNYEVQSTGKLSTAYFDYFMFAVQPIGAGSLSTSDTWELTFDTGTLDPNYSEGFAGVPDVDRVADGDGTFHATYTASPVLYTYGCDVNAGWPWPCTSVATSEEVKLQAEFQERSDEFAGFYSAQSPQGVNGIFLETAPDGSRYLSSEMVNSHYRAVPNDTTVYQGEVRFRMPYTMLRDSFGVPDPSTMVASSLSGTVNGGTTGATFSVYHDPDGGGMFVDITNLTFSRKIIKVRRGVIVPTRPTDVVGKRVDATHARLGYTLSTPRGARVTGYQARCVSPGGDVETALKLENSSPIRVGGLHAGVRYDCKVRAKSKAGYGPWSALVGVPRNP